MTLTYTTLKGFFVAQQKHLRVGLLSVLCVLSAVLASQMSEQRYQAYTLRDYSVKIVKKPVSKSPSPVALRKVRRVKQNKVPVIEKKALPQSAVPQKKVATIASADTLRPAAPEVTPPIVTPEEFPAFEYTVMPVTSTPNWGAMRTPMEWNRSYREMTSADFVELPRYDVIKLKTSLDELAQDLTESSIALITAKLFYSTRFFGAYDLDSGEFEAVHPGVDLKLARGTPIGAIAGGKVHAVKRSEGMGLHVIIEHRLPDESVMFSVYGHFDITLVDEGDSVTPGTPIGVVGMTGNTSAPHLHLQVDADTGARPHKVYWPSSIPTRAEAAKFTVNPLVFIAKYGR